LANTEGKKTTFAINSSCTNTHWIPSNLVQDHPDAVDFVGFDINRPVKLDFNHGVSLHLQENE